MDRYFSTKVYKAKHEKKILFLFPAGFTKVWQYRWTIYLLNRMGVTVVGFDCEWKKVIRECNFDDLLKIVYQVEKTAGEVITDNPQITEYAVLGISFGSVFSLYTAKRHEQIRSIILFVPYGTLSNLLWTHKPSRPFIKTLLQGGLKTEQDLEKLTQPIETQYQLERLKGRRIVSFLGKSDKVVFDGEKLVAAMQRHHLDATFYESRFGHFGTSVVGIARKRKWDKIL